MTRARRHPKPKTVLQAGGKTVTMRDIDWPVPVVAGDQVTFGLSAETGKPVVVRIARAGAQIWPAPVSIETAP